MRTGVLICSLNLGKHKLIRVTREDVEEANKDAPAFSRIFKEMILVTSKEKPMLRTGKGTVMKKAMLKLYETEIDALQVFNLFLCHPRPCLLFYIGTRP